jgi:hypothetical protein
VVCQCGEIGVSGGDIIYSTMAKDYQNFLRIDDNGNEIVVKQKENNRKEDQGTEEKKEVKQEFNDRKHEILGMLDGMIKSYEGLPKHVLLSPITGYDMLSVLLLLSSLFRCKEES